MVHSIAFANREDLARPFVETSRAGYLLAQEVSAYSMVAVARATAPLMTDGGSMITLTYLGSTRVVTNYNVMGVAKARSKPRSLSGERSRPEEYSRERDLRGSCKNRVRPRHQGFLEDPGESRRTRRSAAIPTPAEVADAAVFLASDLGRGVTGDVLFVDAGFHIMGL